LRGVLVHFKFHYVLSLDSLADNLSYNFELHHSVSRLSSMRGRLLSERRRVVRLGCT